MRSNRRQGLGFESLESRSLMAGDVSATVFRGQLFISGGNADNAVQIAPGTTTGEFVITGLNGTTINTAASATVNGVTGAITANLGGGSDSLTAAGITTPRGLFVYDASGPNSVSISNSTINGEAVIYSSGGVATIDLNTVDAKSTLSVVTGRANDHLSLTDVKAGRATTLATGLGDDQIDITGATLNGALAIDSGALIPFLGRLLQPSATDKDTVTVASTTVSGPTLINLADGDDTLNLNTVTANGLSVNAGKGSDTVTVRDSIFAGSVLFSLGDGDDSLTLTNSKFHGRQNGLLGGKGTDTLVNTGNEFTNPATIREFEP